MNFKVKWGDIQKYFRKRLVSESDPSLKFYFEDTENILIFLATKGVVTYSELSKSQINADNFKLEFLSDSVELLENPIKPKEVIRKVVAVSQQPMELIEQTAG